MTGALQGIRVLDFTQGDAGSFCTMQLGDAGADVIKVEPPEGDYARGLGPPFVKGESGFFLVLNRNKRSVALNLKSPQGKEAALKLLKQCDVLVENFRPGVMERLGLGYQAVSRLNPRLIYCSVSALDTEGPEAQLPGTELTLQARSGVMRFIGEPGAPPVRIGTDYLSAATGMYTLQGIVAALYNREKTGLGQRVETSLLRTSVYMQSIYFMADCEPDYGIGNPRTPTGTPATGYRTKDGRIDFSFPFMLVGYPAEERWREFCRELGIGHITEDPRFKTMNDRNLHGKELRGIYEEAFKDRTTQELLALLDRLGALNSPVYNYDGVFSDPQILADEMLLHYQHPLAGEMGIPGFGWKLSRTPGEIRLPPPLLGQHTREVLRSAGYSDAAIAEMERSGATVTTQLPTANV